ncbi:MAG: hypothetical protein PHS41_06375 [Victivallaceae bacterium]|nr:hypothetical protein [Victivallaceae bacterium]
MTLFLEEAEKLGYGREQFPALASQIARWSQSRPLAGVSVLDGTPVFRNTCVKYLALLAAGAELSVAAGRGIPRDDGVFSLLDAWKIPYFVEPRGAEAGAFDLVLDCAGALREVESRIGVVELTRSGAYYYRNDPRSVFLADGGTLKLVETALGTGDGFARAMEELALGDFKGRNFLVFGAGKVGRGVAFAIARRGGQVAMADFPGVTIPESFETVDVGEREEVVAAIRKAWCVVSVTGHASALSPYAAALTDSDALLANMGVEDEYGPDVPAKRVLFDKKPLNFLLSEPTHLCYIDPTMAISNAGALELAQGRVTAPGLTLPPAALEKEYLDEVLAHGQIADELRSFSALFGSLIS